MVVIIHDLEVDGMRIGEVEIRRMYHITIFFSKPEGGLYGQMLNLQTTLTHKDINRHLSSKMIISKIFY